MDGANPAPQAPAEAPAAPQPQQAAPQPDPTFQRPPVGSPERPAPQTVTIPLDVWQETASYKHKLAEFEAQQRAALEAEQQKALLAMAQKGEVEQALEKQREHLLAKEREAQARYAALQESYNAEKINAELATATSGVRFASDEAARVFRASVRDLLTVVDNPDGSKSVVDRVGRRPAADVIRERLSDPSLAFYLAADSRGGAGTDGTRPPANPPQGPPSLLDEMLAARDAQPALFGGIGLGPKSN